MFAIEGRDSAWYEHKIFVVWLFLRLISNILRMLFENYLLSLGHYGVLQL